MAHIVMADDGIEFDGRTPLEKPLGGAETAFIGLAEAFAQRGHHVSVRNKCLEHITHNDVDWAPPETPIDGPIEAYIANRSVALLGRYPLARAKLFWIHNPAGYLLKRRYLGPLFRARPTIVFSGLYHASTYPWWAPHSSKKIIPYGVEDIFRSVEPDETLPPPHAIFTSNPLRSLDWILDLWANDIHPKVPEAELHVYSGASTYGQVGVSRFSEMDKILGNARELAHTGVRVKEPVPKAELARALTKARVLIYKGDPGETFCLSVAEAQAAGVPAVVQPIGSVGERVIDGFTGTVTLDRDHFARATISLLTDDKAWALRRQACLRSQRQWGWRDAAGEFEKLLLDDPASPPEPQPAAAATEN